MNHQQLMRHLHMGCGEPLKTGLPAGCRREAPACGAPGKPKPVKEDKRR